MKQREELRKKIGSLVLGEMPEGVDYLLSDEDNLLEDILDISEKYAKQKAIDFIKYANSRPDLRGYFTLDEIYNEFINDTPDSI